MARPADRRRQRRRRRDRRGTRYGGRDVATRQCELPGFDLLLLPGDNPRPETPCAWRGGRHPVGVQPCDWHPAFGTLLTMPEDGKAIATWANPEEANADLHARCVPWLREPKKRRLGGSHARWNPAGFKCGRTASPEIEFHHAPRRLWTSRERTTDGATWRTILLRDAVTGQQMAGRTPARIARADATARRRTAMKGMASRPCTALTLNPCFVQKRRARWPGHEGSSDSPIRPIR